MISFCVQGSNFFEWDRGPLADLKYIERALSFYDESKWKNYEHKRNK
jgi:hypothetical protein